MGPLTFAVMTERDQLEVPAPKVCGVATNPPAATFGPRHMRDYEFVWMLQGGCTYHWGSQTVEVPEGGVVLCRPGAVDGFDWDPGQRSAHAYTHFDIDQLPGDWPAPASWPFARVPGEGDVFRPLMRHLLTWMERDRPDLCQQTLAMLLTTYVLGAMDTANPPGPDLPEPVAAALRHLQARLEADPRAAVTLPDLAEAACVSEGYLCRVFKTSIGHTPAETVRRTRLDRAAAMLARSNEPVKRVAEATGFASPYHFSRRFREAFGASPTEFRKQVRAGRMPPLPLRHLRLARHAPPRA